MSEKNPQSSSLQSATINSTETRWGNRPSEQVDSASIEFDKGVTPFVETEDEVLDENELQDYQQQVADDIQLQLTGTLGSVSVSRDPLLQSNGSMMSGNAWQRFLTVVSQSRYTTVIVILIYVFVITIALLFGRVDISGMTEIPVIEPTTKPLPPLKSYLITPAEYDKLVERAQSNAAVQSTEPEKFEQSEETDGQEIESVKPIIN